MILAALGSVFLFVALMNVLFWPRVRREAQGTVSVSVLIPARNEETNLAGALESILAQGPFVREVLVYDDHSTDGTSALIQRFAAADARVNSVAVEALPAGWCGKNFACWRLAHAAQGDWLLYLDADARLRPGATSRIVGEAQSRNLSLLSCWPAVDAFSFWERSLMPMLNFVVFSLFPAPLSLARMDPSLGIAHGACMLFHRSTYFAAGGHAAVREEIFEDVRLARHWRSSGHRALCLDGQDVVHVRMYRTFAEIWLGFQKNYFPAFHSSSMFWLFLVLRFAAFLLPFLVLNRIAIAIVLAARVLLAIRFRQVWWTPLTHPFGEILTLALGLSSWWQCRSGRGVAWKGRVYRAS